MAVTVWDACPFLSKPLINENTPLQMTLIIIYVNPCFWGLGYGVLLFSKYILLIMLLQLSYFLPFTPILPAYPLPPTFPHFSSCPWVILRSSLASTFPICSYPSPVYFLPTIYAIYSLYLSPLSPPPTPLLKILHVISISVVLFLF